jgi:hypothetical protein
VVSGNNPLDSLVVACRAANVCAVPCAVIQNVNVMLTAYRATMTTNVRFIQCQSMFLARCCLVEREYLVVLGLLLGRRRCKSPAAAAAGSTAVRPI